MSNKNPTSIESNDSQCTKEMTWRGRWMSILDFVEPLVHVGGKFS